MIDLDEATTEKLIINRSPPERPNYMCLRDLVNIAKGRGPDVDEQAKALLALGYAGQGVRITIAEMTLGTLLGVGPTEDIDVLARRLIKGYHQFDHSTSVAVNYDAIHPDTASLTPLQTYLFYSLLFFNQAYPYTAEQTRFFLDSLGSEGFRHTGKLTLARLYHPNDLKAQARTLAFGIAEDFEIPEDTKDHELPHVYYKEALKMLNQPENREIILPANCLITLYKSLKDTPL